VSLGLRRPDGTYYGDTGLIDTGADGSAFPSFLMAEFGLLKKHCREEEFETAGGIATQWIASERIDAWFMGRSFSLEPVFCDTPITLLGRDDFLIHFRATFDERANRVRLQLQ